MSKNEKFPPYRAAMSVNHRILSLSNDIAFRLGKLSCLGTVEGDEDVWAEETRYTLLQEGIALTPSEVRALHQGKEVPSEKKAFALLKFYSSLDKLDPYSPSFLSSYESAVYPDGVPMRKSQTIEGCDYLLPSPSKVRGLLENLFAYAAKNREAMSPTILACLLYYEVLSLLPYSAENGLLARLWFKAMLSKAGRSMSALRIGKALHFNSKKLDSAFKEASERQDSAPFVEALLELISSSVSSLLHEASRKENSSSPLVDRLLSKMASGRYYSATELCALLGLKSRLGLQKNYLRPALARQKIAMSNPLCPTDRNQRYRKKEGI